MSRIKFWNWSLLALLITVLRINLQWIYFLLREYCHWSETKTRSGSTHNNLVKLTRGIAMFNPLSKWVRFWSLYTMIGAVGFSAAILSLKIFDEQRDNRLKCQGLWSPLNRRNGAEKADHGDHSIHYCKIIWVYVHQWWYKILQLVIKV